MLTRPPSGGLVVGDKQKKPRQWRGIKEEKWSRSASLVLRGSQFGLGLVELATLLGDLVGAAVVLGAAQFVLAQQLDHLAVVLLPDPVVAAVATVFGQGAL